MRTRNERKTLGTRLQRQKKNHDKFSPAPIVPDSDAVRIVTNSETVANAIKAGNLEWSRTL